MEVPPNFLQGERRPCPQLADIEGSTTPTEAGPVPRHSIRTISAPYILKRFLTIESESESLRHEAHIGILEGRVCEGEDMLSKRIEEEGWEEVDAVDESISSLDLGTPSEQEGRFQGILALQIYPEAYPNSSSD